MVRGLTKAGLSIAALIAALAASGCASSPEARPGPDAKPPAAPEKAPEQAPPEKKPVPEHPPDEQPGAGAQPGQGGILDQLHKELTLRDKERLALAEHYFKVGKAAYDQLDY